MPTTKPNTKPLNLALQGGGAHGAFTWGVLDKLLEDGRIHFEAISATSAGSMNAAVMAYGIHLNGHDGAREKLEEFWYEISNAGNKFSVIRPNAVERFLGLNNLEYSPAFHFFEALSRAFSPYQLNPFNFNPLKDVLNKVVKFDELCKCKDTIKLFLCATNVRSGKSKIFKNEDLSAETVLASACLPFMFQAVKIKDDYYWDGGYVGNPAIYPLTYHTDCKDIMVVHINPLYRDEVPYTAPDIYNRINEISFNSSLMNEMRAIAFVQKLVKEGKLSESQYKSLRIHAVSNDNVMTKLGVSSKLNPDWDFLCYLRDEGRKTAEEWLDQHFNKIGKESSLDIRKNYL